MLFSFAVLVMVVGGCSGQGLFPNIADIVHGRQTLSNDTLPSGFPACPYGTTTTAIISYQVQQSDTWTSISNSSGISVNRLLRFNGLSSSGSMNLVPETFVIVQVFSFEYQIVFHLYS